MNQQVRGITGEAREARKGTWAEAWESKTHRPGVVFRAAFSSSSSTLPHGPSTPLAGAPQLSSTLPFFLQDARRWKTGGEAARPVQEDSGLLGELMVVVVSEVKVIQVPHALPAWRAPHPAVIALQIFLPLPLLLCLFSSLHLVGGGGGVG